MEASLSLHPTSTPVPSAGASSNGETPSTLMNPSQKHGRGDMDEQGDLASAKLPGPSEDRSSSAPDKRPCKSKYRECVSCAFTLNYNAFPSRLPTSSCNHPRDTCRKCLRKWMETSLANSGGGQSPAIICPQCSATMSYADVRLLASAAVFERCASPPSPSLPGPACSTRRQLSSPSTQRTSSNDQNPATTTYVP